MKIFWFIPTHGDSRYLGTSKGARQGPCLYETDCGCRG